MKELLHHIIEGILGNDSFEIVEIVTNDRIDLVVRVPKDTIGLVIGKQGSMIKAIRSLLRVKATLDQNLVYVNVEEQI